MQLQIVPMVVQDYPIILLSNFKQDLIKTNIINHVVL